jgi:hypothetical protein
MIAAQKVEYLCPLEKVWQLKDLFFDRVNSLWRLALFSISFSSFSIFFIIKAFSDLL